LELGGSVPAREARDQLPALDTLQADLLLDDMIGVALDLDRGTNGCNFFFNRSPEFKYNRHMPSREFLYLL
jgi:hypothetical protein